MELMEDLFLPLFGVVLNGPAHNLLAFEQHRTFHPLLAQLSEYTGAILTLRPRFDVSGQCDLGHIYFYLLR